MSKAKEYHDQVIADFNEVFDDDSKPYFLTTAIKQANHKTIEDVKAKENDLLNLFCLFLEDDGYLDTDWRAEEPFAIDEFRKSKQYRNWKTELENLKL